MVINLCFLDLLHSQLCLCFVGECELEDPYFAILLMLVFTYFKLSTCITDILNKRKIKLYVLNVLQHEGRNNQFSQNILSDFMSPVLGYKALGHHTNESS